MTVPDPEVDRRTPDPYSPRKMDNSETYIDAVAPEPSDPRPEPKARFRVLIRSDGKVEVDGIRLAEPLMGDPPSSPTATAAAPTNERALPVMLLPAEVALLLRTTSKAVYTRIERGLLPGVVRVKGGRTLVDRDVLLRELRTKKGRGR